MLEDITKHLKELERMELQIVAEGNYPTKAQTPVAHVAMYQNDGTEKIKPARFVQKAAASKNDWRMKVYAAILAYLDGNNDSILKVGKTIADDIMFKIGRIDTRRLRMSLVPKITKKKRASRAQ